jgi:hypothetical protein
MTLGVDAIMTSTLKTLAVFSVLFSMSDVSLALCEVELESMIRATNNPDYRIEHARTEKNCFVGNGNMGPGNAEERRTISIPARKRQIAELQSYARPSFADIQNLARVKLELCYLEVSITDCTKKLDSPTAVKQAVTNDSQPAVGVAAPRLQASSQQNQTAQQQAQQAQDAARVAQTRADQARKEQRRRHEPENEASQCIQPDFGGLYGGMKNTCDFKVWYTYCGYRPKESSWLTGMSCEKQSFGSDSVSPGRTSASHTKGVESIHWIACKEPAWALDAEFVPGQGIKGRCYTVGGK